MATCRFDTCNRNADDNTKDGYCILHSESPDKDKDAFDKALVGHPGPTFSNIVFPPDAVFTDSEFTSAIFIGAIFLGKANFRMKSFTGLIDFQYARFDGTADFAKATFDGEVNFGGAHFMENARFSNAKFKKGANFRGTTFLKDANFFHAEFGEDTDASEGLSHAAQVLDAYPAEGANFNEAKFERKADFTCVRFISGEADFRNTKFADEAIFGGIELGEKAGKANFLNAHFAKEANFVRARLITESDFTSATFEKGAFFDRTIFAGRVVFDGATFLGRTLFEPEKKRAEDLIFAGAQEVFFTNVTMEPLNVVTFKDADLQRCWFQGTDLRKAEITGAIWPKIHRMFPKTRDCCPRVAELLTKIRRLLPKTSTGFGAYDEEDLLKGKEDAWDHIEQLYRQLKQNFEDRRDYERANDFHYGEKEMRRKNPETSCGLKFLLSVYWAVSGYGERWVRPLVWAAILLILSAVGYHWWGLEPKPDSKIAVAGLWDYCDYSLRVMTHLKHDDLVPIGCAKYVNTLESIAGPVLLGLFGLALRQRLKR